MSVVQSLLLLLYIGLVLYGAWCDARDLKIPNSISLALLALFVPTAVVAGIGLESIAWHFAAGVVVLVAGFVLFAVHLFGGGDAKLLAVTALWVGWTDLLSLIIAVVLVGGVLSLLVVLLRKGVGLWPTALVRRLEGLFTPNKAVPYGIAIAVGAVLTVPRMDVLPESWTFLARYALGG